VNDDDLCGTFLYGLTRLQVDEHGLSADNELADLNAVAALCIGVKIATADGDTPEQLCLHRVATLTERLITTWVVRDDRAAGDWMIARAELLQLSLPHP
jgi:hypothetical protein